MRFFFLYIFVILAIAAEVFFSTRGFVFPFTLSLIIFSLGYLTPLGFLFFALCVSCVYEIIVPSGGWHHAITVMFLSVGSILIVNIVGSRKEKNAWILVQIRNTAIVAAFFILYPLFAIIFSGLVPDLGYIVSFLIYVLILHHLFHFILSVSGNVVKINLQERSR